MIRIFYEATVKKLQASISELARWPGSPFGVPLVSRSIRYIETCTPSATPLANGPCDEIYLSADANVELTAADNTAASFVILPLKAGAWIPLACSCVKATSAGTVTLGWYRRPA